MKNIEVWTPERRERYIDLCKKWIEGNLTPQNIKDTVKTFDWAVGDLLPELEDKVYASNSLHILMLDIMEMDSISDEEKDSSIMRLYERRKEELQDLARRVIEQIEINTKEFKKEAEERGYCPILTKQQTEK